MDDEHHHIPDPIHHHLKHKAKQYVRDRAHLQRRGVPEEQADRVAAWMMKQEPERN